jgi:hypothetical protein
LGSSAHAGSLQWSWAFSSIVIAGKCMEKKLTNSGPLRVPADKYSIYTIKK